MFVVIDDYSKSKAIIPGVGHYQKVDDGYKRLSKLPTSLRKMR